jgi:hypothetical protein
MALFVPFLVEAHNVRFREIPSHLFECDHKYYALFVINLPPSRRPITPEVEIMPSYKRGKLRIRALWMEHILAQLMRSSVVVKQW